MRITFLSVRPSKNIGAVDLIVTPDKLFQMTISLKHFIKQNVLVKTMENMRYKNGEKIWLFFVVPDDIYDEYKYQKFITPSNN